MSTPRGPLRVPIALPRVRGRAPWWELAGVLTVCLTIALLRSAPAILDGAVWAEDGAVFLQYAYSHPQAGLTRSYAGYLHVVPRLLATIVEQFPLAWHGVLICAAAALVQAVLATFVYQVVRAHAPARLAAAICALAVVNVPVGPETVGNVANLQWFLLFAGCLAPLSRARTRAGWLASALVLLAVTTSSPFGAIPVGVAAVAWFVCRARASLVLLGVGLAGLLVQVTGMLTASGRVPAPGSVPGPGDLVGGYLARVAGDGFLGWSRHGSVPTMTSTSPTAGLLVLAAVLGLLVVLGRRGGLRAIGLPLVLLGLSLLLWLPPVVISRLDTAFVVLGARYHVAPALCLLAAGAVLVERAWLVRPAGRPARHVPGVVGAGLGAALVLASAYGQVTTWAPTSDFFRRTTMVPWADQVHRESTCAGTPGGAATIAIVPPGWEVQVPCRLFD